MHEIGRNRTSGASLAVVVLAVVGTAGYGALSKRAEAGSSRPPEVIRGAYDFDLRLIDQGTGIAPVPTAPPAARWQKFELVANGQPVHHRPVQFRKTAVDAKGRKLVAEHRWSGGYFYTFVRSGFRRSDGPVSLTISFRDRLIKQLTLDALPKPVRAIVPVRTPPKWPGLTAAVVRTPNDDAYPLGLRVNAPLNKDEALVVQPIGSSFLSREPYGDLTFAKAGTFGVSRVVPLPIGYPQDVDAVSVRVIRFRSRPLRQIVEFGLRYSGSTESDHHFALRPSNSQFAGGIMLTLSRFDRSIALPRDGSRPLRIFVAARQIAGRSRVRLISPSSVNGIPVDLGNHIYSAEGVGQVLPAQKGNDVRIGVVDQTIPIKIEMELWEYQPVYEETLVIPFKFDRLPIESNWNRYPLRYLG